MTLAKKVGGRGVSAASRRVRPPVRARRTSSCSNSNVKAVRAALTGTITALPGREATVSQMYLVEDLSLEDIGRTMGVGARRVCQIKQIEVGHVCAELSKWEA